MATQRRRNGQARAQSELTKKVIESARKQGKPRSASELTEDQRIEARESLEKFGGPQNIIRENRLKSGDIANGSHRRMLVEDSNFKSDKPSNAGTATKKNLDALPSRENKSKYTQKAPAIQSGGKKTMENANKKALEITAKGMAYRKAVAAAAKQTASDAKAWAKEEQKKNGKKRT